MTGTTGGRLIVFEGVDGAGKSTQIGRLIRTLEGRGRRVVSLHFPRTAEPVSGELIAMFLRGELGGVDAVHPYLVAMMFAVDRLLARPMLTDLLAGGTDVVLDRYVHSNIAFQAAKLPEQDRAALIRWVEALEFDRFALPRPDVGLYLRVPMRHVEATLSRTRTGEDRSYLQGRDDIHEGSVALQKSVASVYETLAGPAGGLVAVDCGDGDGGMRPADAVEAAITAVLTDRRIL